MTDIGSNEFDSLENEDYAESFRSIVDQLNPIEEEK